VLDELEKFVLGSDLPFSSKLSRLGLLKYYCFPFLFIYTIHITASWDLAPLLICPKADKLIAGVECYEGKTALDLIEGQALELHQELITPYVINGAINSFDSRTFRAAVKSIKSSWTPQVDLLASSPGLKATPLNTLAARVECVDHQSSQKFPDLD
jgi:hypothetical protein